MPVVGLVTAVLTLIAGVGTVYIRSRPKYPSSWDPRVSALVRFVEHERGADFEHPVEVEFLSIADFKAYIHEGSEGIDEESREGIDAYAGGFRALGLVSGDVDLLAESTKAQEEGVIGLYDLKDEKIRVRGTVLTADVRVTMVHELTHALQDQMFDLEKLQERATADTPLRTLIESDAIRVQDAYMEGFDETQLDEFYGESAAGAGDTSSVPDVLLHGLSFPYVFGPAFIAAIHRQGGSAAIDKAFAKPPTSEADIIDPTALPPVGAAPGARCPHPGRRRGAVGSNRRVRPGVARRDARHSGRLRTGMARSPRLAGRHGTVLRRR